MIGNINKVFNGRIDQKKTHSTFHSSRVSFQNRALAYLFFIIFSFFIREHSEYRKVYMLRYFIAISTQHWNISTIFFGNFSSFSNTASVQSSLTIRFQFVYAFFGFGLFTLLKKCRPLATSLPHTHTHTPIIRLCVCIYVCTHSCACVCVSLFASIGCLR